MPDAEDPADLLERAAGGDRASLARLLSIVERGGPEARALGRLTHPRGGSGYTIGITGAPGAGKSTLTNVLIGHIRAAGDAVAVLAIDPSSPFSGGAILGDRVRMQDHTGDASTFIRSMATRGHLGGLSLSTLEAIRALDATGWPWIVVETVGVGQVEVEVAGAADTTVVVVNPGWGDAVQANKAGLLEIADIFVINKADRPGAEEARRDLDRMLDLTDAVRLAAAHRRHHRGHRRRRGGSVVRHRCPPRAPHRHRAARGPSPLAHRGRDHARSSPRCSASGPGRPTPTTSSSWPPQVAARELDPWAAAAELLPD